jgi:Rhodanese-like domain
MTRILTLFILTVVLTACSNATISTPAYTPELNVVATHVSTFTSTQGQTPTPVVLLTPTQTPRRLPATEAEVPRVTVENAKAAFDAGKAVIVDVRSQPAYNALHIEGAIYIPLADFENNFANLPFDKDQWIITYCT